MPAPCRHKLRPFRHLLSGEFSATHAPTRRPERPRAPRKRLAKVDISPALVGESLRIDAGDDAADLLCAASTSLKVEKSSSRLGACLLTRRLKSIAGQHTRPPAYGVDLRARCK